jgi:hypothetical protein
VLAPLKLGGAGGSRPNSKTFVACESGAAVLVENERSNMKRSCCYCFVLDGVQPVSIKLLGDHYKPCTEDARCSFYDHLSLFFLFGE